MVLAGAGFAGDEKRCRRRSDFLREFEQAERSGSDGDPGKPVGHEAIVATGGTVGFAACDAIAERDTESTQRFPNYGAHPPPRFCVSAESKGLKSLCFQHLHKC